MDDDIFQFEAPQEAAPQLVLSKKKKKKKKKKDDPSPSASSALDVEAEHQPDSNVSVNGGGKSSLPAETVEDDSAFSAVHAASTLHPDDQDLEMLGGGESDRNVVVKDPATIELTEDPSTSGTADSFEITNKSGQDSDSVSKEKRPMTAAEKKKAKKEREKVAKLEKTKKEKEELDAILAELGDGEPHQPTAPVNGTEEGTASTEAMTAAQKKRAKKKKKATIDKVEHNEDIDAILAELAPEKSQPQDKNSSEAAEANDVTDLLAELGGGADASSKKKAKKKKKKTTNKATDDGEVQADAGDAQAQGESKKPKKKESAVVRRMREQREKMLAEEERLRKLHEEEEARIAEEERKREEEEKRRQEEKARKKAAEKAKRERKRQEGTLLSKAEREKRRKAEIFRKQMMERGMVPAVATPSREQDSGQRIIYGRRRKNAPQKKPEEASDVSQPPVVDPAVSPAHERSPAEEQVVEGCVPDSWDELPDDGTSPQAVKQERSIGDSEQKTVSFGSKINPRDVESIQDRETDGSDSDDSDDSDYEGMSKMEIAAEKRLEAFRKGRAKQRAEAIAARSRDHLRSPVICILGHVDTGKTKILDRIRRTNVQDGEAGGITQQIGATYFPIDAVKKEATKLVEGKNLDYNVPSLLIIDTPGHESFTNLRSRGSSLCDIAILVVDIMHGLEPQTRESIDLLKLRKTPFIVALNKIDRIYDWSPQPHNCPTRDSLSKQPRHAREEFGRRVQATQLEFAEIGFNTELYWENQDVRKTISLVPTSAISGEGIPDLLMLLLALPQRLLVERLMFSRVLEATVLEVKVIEGLGTTIDIILTGGTISEGDTIMVVGLDGPIVTTIRALLTPHPMKEMRVKGQYLHHKEIQAAQGIKISADGLEKAIAGTQLMVVDNPNDPSEIEYVKEEVMKDFQTILTNVDKSGLGVYVQASTLGSLEALLEFLRTSKIPVSGINIGPVHKRDVTKASTMLERRKEFATILAFDVSVEKEAKELAEELGVKVFTADIIYHLFDQFNVYMEDVKKQRRDEVKDDVVFPSICKILPQHVYNKKDPIVVGVDVMEGILKVGTPLVVRHGNGWLDVGRVASIELNKRQVQTAKKGDSVAVKIQSKTTEHIMYGRHFDFQDQLVSKMSRSAINLLKESFRDDLQREDWILVVKLKAMFNIE